ncbi:MAG: 2-phospho-L-lactate guanylyltransferase [Acidimicrobiia bacterium]
MVVVPVKSFSTGKERLSPALDPDARAFLIRAMADHVASVAESAGLLPVLVTDSPEVAEWGAARGLPSLQDPGRGLSAAAEAGIAWARSTGSGWLVVHADLPMLRPEDLSALTEALAEGADPISPSADGGTSAIGGGEPPVLAYGPGSFHRHLPRLASPRVVVRPGLAHDIDSPADLESARGHPDGAWLDRALS